MKKTILALFMLTLLSVPISSAQELPATPPSVDQVQSGEKFNDAYINIIQRNYWDGIKLIESSLALNPYNVDAYLLKSLTLYRMGHLNGALHNLKNYLEVRPRDIVAQKIYNSMNSVIRDSLSPLPIKFRGESHLISSFMNITPPLYRGTLGIADALWVGDILCIADMLGDKIYVIKKTTLSSIGIKRPLSLAFIDDFSFAVNSEEGLIEYHRDSRGEFKEVRRISPEDKFQQIIFLNNRECVTTNPSKGFISIRSYPELKTLKKWQPEGDSFIETRGIACLGSKLAISDINRDKIYISDVSFENIKIIDGVESPRAVLFASPKDLLVLSDMGKLMLFREGQNSWEMTETIFTPEGFTLTKGNKALNIITGDGRKIYNLYRYPSQKESIITGLSLFSPQITDAEDGKILTLSAQLSSSYKHYLYSQKPVLSSVWQDTMRPGKIEFYEDHNPGEILFIVDKSNRYLISSDVDRVIYEEGKLEEQIAQQWEANNRNMSIILDNSIIAKQVEIEWLLRFCKFNGVTLSLWSTIIPSDNMVNAALNSGGKVYYTLNIAGEHFKKAISNNLKFKIFYPQTTYSSGYPSKNMLSTIADFGIISYRDWLPLWPDILKAK